MPSESGNGWSDPESDPLADLHRVAEESRRATYDGSLSAGPVLRTADGRLVDGEEWLNREVARRRAEREGLTDA